jgi:hypothetical protein
LEEVLMDEEFNLFQKNFFDEYALVFEPGPENRLEYMDIFQKYVNTFNAGHQS